MAKGLTSGYIPMGAVMVTPQVAEYFNDRPLVGGLTYSAHTLAAAAAIANIGVMKNEKLVENSRKMGKILRAGLNDLAEKHSSIGDVRGIGLHQIIELVKDRQTKEPLSEFNAPLSEPMQKAASKLRDLGMHTFVKWNWIFCSPPLVINENQLQEGLQILDQALEEIDTF